MPSPIRLSPGALYGARATGLGRGPFNNRYIERTQAQYGGGMAPLPGFVIPICGVARLGPLVVGFATFSYTPRPQRLNLPFPP